MIRFKFAQKSAGMFLKALENTFPTLFTYPKLAHRFPKYSPDQDQNLGKLLLGWILSVLGDLLCVSVITIIYGSKS